MSDDVVDTTSLEYIDHHGTLVAGITGTGSPPVPLHEPLDTVRDAIDAAALKQLREYPDAYFKRTHKRMPEMFRREPEPTHKPVTVPIPLPSERVQRILQDAIDESERAREDWRSRRQVKQRRHLFRKKDLVKAPEVPTPLPVEKIARILGDASHGTVSPERALDIARRALDEACDNREGK